MALNTSKMWSKIQSKLKKKVLNLLNQASDQNKADFVQQITDHETDFNFMSICRMGPWNNKNSISASGKAFKNYIKDYQQSSDVMSPISAVN